jgi:ubiquinone/menaquinone biosynthesis C-methylase UbiE
MKKYPFIRIIVSPIFRTVKLLFFKVQDFIDYLNGNSNPLIPPRSMIFIGDGDYKKTGDEFLLYFKELGGLRPDDKVLDVGCGIGRMSVPLTDYLSEDGTYFGFDIVKKGIDWCKSNISSRYKNFHFVHSNIHNKMYNPNGLEKSSEYKFKYEDDSFNFIFLTSVFTHMYIEDINQYLSEISRVLKPGGRCLITFFLINEKSKSLITSGLSSQNLVHKLDDHSYIKDTIVPESAIGFTEEHIKILFNDNSLRILYPIYYGSWCGRDEFKSYQDIIIAEKVKV